MRKLGFLGPEGTFTHQAAVNFTQGSANLVAYSTIRELALAVENAELDLAVIPMENSLEGSVNQSLDILAWEAQLFIQAELILPISHNLLVNPGSTWRDLKEIYTHPQAAAQCRKFLESELPHAKVHHSYSTAQGVDIAKAKGLHYGSIAPLQAAKIFAMDVARQGIEDTPNNCTRFVVLGRTPTNPSGKDKTSIIFSTEHQPGSLYKVLDIFSLWDINMNKIESRPSREKLGNYIFFVDIEGHALDCDLADALTMIKRKTTLYKFLGSYPRAD